MTKFAVCSVTGQVGPRCSQPWMRARLFECQRCFERHSLLNRFLEIFQHQVKRIGLELDRLSRLDFEPAGNRHEPDARGSEPRLGTRAAIPQAVACDTHRICSRGGSSPARVAWGSSIPNLVALPLHGDAGGVADLDPDAARAGPIGAVDPLRYDALGAKLARVSQHGRPILDDVFVQQDAWLGLAQQSRQRRLAVQEWEIAQIPAIMLDQVEGVEDRGSSGLTAGQLLEPGQTVRPQHNRLAVNREALSLDPLGSSRNG
jgi:hypothetical protein